MTDEQSAVWKARLRFAAAEWREQARTARESVGLALGQLEQMTTERDNWHAEALRAIASEQGAQDQWADATRESEAAHQREAALRDELMVWIPDSEDAECLAGCEPGNCMDPNTHAGFFCMFRNCAGPVASATDARHASDCPVLASALAASPPAPAVCASTDDRFVHVDGGDVLRCERPRDHEGLHTANENMYYWPAPAAESISDLMRRADNEMVREMDAAFEAAGVPLPATEARGAMAAAADGGE